MLFLLYVIYLVPIKFARDKNFQLNLEITILIIKIAKKTTYTVGILEFKAIKLKNSLVTFFFIFSKK